jgi:hypothetical protein
MSRQPPGIAASCRIRKSPIGQASDGTMMVEVVDGRCCQES